MRTILLICLMIPGSVSWSQSRKAALSGTWVSMDDSRSRIVFTAGKQLDYYDGKFLGTSYYVRKGDELTVTDESGSDYHYSIVSLTATKLTMIYTDRGNLLRYRRVISKLKK